MRTVPASEIRFGNPTLIDVREYPEFAAGFIQGAQLVPLSQVAGRASTWTKSASFVMICKSGRRATSAAEKLEAMGFSNVSVLDGGVEHGGSRDFLFRPSAAARGLSNGRFESQRAPLSLSLVCLA
jgi:rhodanese-related sulfurtransferase